MEQSPLLEDYVYQNDWFKESNLNITPEQIKQLTESTKLVLERFADPTKSYLTEESLALINEAKENKKKVETAKKKFFKDKGKKFDKVTKDTSQSVVNIVKAKGINSQSLKEIDETISRNVTGSGILREFDENVIEQYLDDYDYTKMQKAAIIFSAVFILNSVLDAAFGILMPGFGHLITHIVVAPITEELGKRAAVREDCEVEFTILFNAIEFSMYVVGGVKLGEELVHMLILRTGPVLMHIGNTIIHYITNNEQIMQKLHLTNGNKDDEAKINTAGFITAAGIHAVWNTVAVIIAVAGI